jgi:spore maturation protein CgeB
MVIKNIILVGKCSLDPKRYTYPSSFHTTLTELGYNVTLINYDLSADSWLKLMPTRLRNFFHIKIINYHLKKAALTNNPDLILCIKADLIAPTTLCFIKKQRPQTKFAIFYPDNPFTFWNGNSNANILKALPIYDYFLIWSKMLMPALESAGAKNVRYFPFAFDEKIFQSPAPADPEPVEGCYTSKTYTCDVSFIGTWDPDREWWLTELITRMPKLNLAIWGNRWTENLPTSSPLQKHLRGKAIYMQEMLKAFSCCKITLNFIRQQNITSHNMRTFEALASNVFMLTQRTTEQTTLPFLEEENIECFATPDELMKKIAFYLDHDTIRKSIANKGQQLAQHFTLRKQLQTLVQDIGDDKVE